MKKFTLLIALMLLAVTGSYAQASLYTFAQSNGAYVPITGGTVITTSTDGSPNLDSYTSPQQSLPAAFSFAGTVYNNFYVTSNGQVGLGNTSPSTTNYTVLSSNTGGNVFFAPLSADLEEGANGLAEIRYEMVGDEIVIQWTNFRRYSYSESFNIQARLNTVNGEIKFVYDGMPPYSTSTGYQPQVGIKSAVGAYSALTVATGVSWNTPTVITTGITSSSTASLKGDDGFTSGLTYTWAPPAPCSGTPLAGTVTGDLMRNICAGSTPAAIVVADATPAIPGIVYQWEQSLNGTDWADVTDGSGANTVSYTPVAFDGTAKQYRLKVTCTNSSETVYADAVTIDNQTAPSTQVTALTTTSSLTTIGLSWTNGNGGRRLVIFSSEPITDPVSQDGISAYTAATLYANAGQQIVYDGTGTSVTVAGLACNSTYYVKVYEYNRCGSGPYNVYINTTTTIAENAVSVATSQPTTANLPVANNFTGFTGSNLATAVPGWYEANVPTTGGDTPLSINPGGTASSWSNSSVFGVTTARINLYYYEKNDWIISPKMEITADSRLVFDAAITNYSSGSADSDGMQGTDDGVNVLVSTDGCGAEWTSIYTFNAANTTELTNALTEYQLLLTDYIGQTIQIAFQATDGPVNDDPDYDFHIGNIVVEEIPACELPTLLATTAVTKNSATIAWQAPAIGTPVGYEYVVSDSNAEPTTAGTATTELTVNVTELVPSTDYYVFVRSNCDGPYSEWTAAGTFTTLCDYPEIETFSATEVCGIGTSDLAATATGGTIKWYTEETGGFAIAEGATFTTEEITETTTYYVGAVGDETFVSGGARVATTSTTNTSPSDYGLRFDVYSAFTLNSVDVYLTGSSSGTLVIELQDGTGSVLETASVSVPAGNSSTPVQHTINLDWNIPAGEGLRLMGVSGPSMVREISLGGFPYEVGSVASVIDGYAFDETSNNYYYFYNWSFTDGCASPRTAVEVLVNDAPAITVSDAVGLCPGESTEISVTSDNTDYTYNWMPGNLDGASHTVTPTETTTYTVTATDAVSGCVTTGTVTVTVNPLPSPIVVTPSPAAVCVSSVQALEVTGGTLGGESTVGDGTDLTGTTEELTAFCNRRDTHKSQTIYTAADLNAAGLSAGTIVSIAYDVTSIGSAATNDDYTVKIGTTALDAFPDSSYLDESGFVTVFAPTTYTHEVGLNTLIFTTPFEWDGVSNIVVSISQSGADSLYNAQTYYTDMGANTTIYNYNDLEAATGTVSSKRFNATFTIEGSTEITWSPVTNLYTDADATVAYTEGTSATTVYFKSDVAVTETYTVTSTSDAGCSVSSTVDNADVTLCDGSVVTDLMATGDNIQWYADETGGTALAGDTVVTEGTYYASQTVDGCESIARTALNVTLYTIPTPEVTVVHPGCGETTGSITFTVPLGDSFVYSIDGGINFQASPAFLGLVPGDYTPIVRNSDNDCQVTLETETINPVPPVPSVASVTVVQPFCEVTTGTITITDPVGDEFDYSINGIDFQDSPIFADLEPGIYVVTVMNASGCTSVSAEIVINPAAVVNAPTVDNANVTICNAGTIAELMANGDNIQWYADETGGAALTGDTALANGTYYASQTVDGCESATRTAVTVTVNVVAAPTGDANQTISVDNAADATIEDIVVTAEAGAVVTWYASEADAIAGENSLAAGTELTDGATYYATQTIDGCESDAVLAVTVGVVLGRDDFNIKTFSYYPNPVQNVLNISYDKEITSVAVFNLLGQQVMAKTPNTNEVKLDMSILSDGTYLVSVTADNTVKTIKVVKKQ